MLGGVCLRCKVVCRSVRCKGSPVVITRPSLRLTHRFTNTQTHTHRQRLKLALGEKLNETICIYGLELLFMTAAACHGCL